MYRYEQNLVDDFLKSLHKSKFAHGDTHYITEFNYSRGKTDIVILNNNSEIIAIEAKLKRWRDALDQAYRNTCFAHYNYVLVPERVALTAQKYLAEFTKRSVGICFISDGIIQIAYEAKQNKPLQQWLNDRAIQTILNGEANVRIH